MNETSVNSSLGSIVLREDLRLNTLLADAALIGGIYTMGYNEAYVLTNDLWKSNAGGIPQHCFLLATVIEKGSAPDAEDEEIILMRVVGPAPLPQEGELLEVRAQAMREMVTAQGQQAVSSPRVLDVLTRNEMQFSAVKVKILGTFYENQVAHDRILAFGSDIETYYSSSRYKVYKPYGTSLAVIASYPEVTEDEERERQNSGREPRRVRIGAVRYSSSTRRRAIGQQADRNIAVPVMVNIEDFVSMKTAVFGMTRLGKSNTMKTIATAVFQHASETGQSIGQLLFDPAGEYANVNEQDQTALSMIGQEFVTIFRFGADGQTSGVRPLTTNFFSEDNLQQAWSIVSSYLSTNNSNVRYIDNFLAVNIIGPETLQDNPSLYKRARRRRSIFYACLLKAEFPPPINFSCSFAVNATVLAAVNSNKVNASAADFSTTAQGNLQLNRQRLLEWCDNLSHLLGIADGAPPTNLSGPATTAWVATMNEVKAWADDEVRALLTIYKIGAGAGYRILLPLREFHGTTRDTDYASEVLTELEQGKIVIVDLSRGTESILKYCSEYIINYILKDAANRFAAGTNARKMQIFLEEAHRLFDRDNMKIRSEADPYVRLAKEAAKYKIGLIYATQEVSSVDPLILSNTSNWIVTHLNNLSEIRELSKYYDFADFSEITVRAEDVGFARVKTRSSRYIIPTQIDKFDQSRIAVARQAGLNRLNPPAPNTNHMLPNQPLQSRNRSDDQQQDPQQIVRQ